MGGIIILLILLLLFFNFGRSLFSAKGYEKAAQALPLMQDYLTEAAAAKIMGDAIIAAKPTPGAAWSKVTKAGQSSSENLSALALPDLLADYQATAVAWSNQVVAASKNTKTWKDLTAQPGDFKLTLNNAKAKEFFKTSLQNIAALKEFGDAAIKRKDKEAMRYIAAKLLVQEHWLNGLLHSTKAGWLAVGPVPAARAEEPFKYGQPIRNVCLNITGVAGAYCAQAAIQSVNEIAASAIGFAEGENIDEEEWEQDWEEIEKIPLPEGTAGQEVSQPSVEGGHLLEGEGITEGESVLEIELSPTVRIFYNQCQAKGGIVGGSGKVMARMPTTESGHKCEYKTDSPNFGKGIPCWDLLTYSGGRYLGGNSGCPEHGLVPVVVAPVVAPAPATEKTAPAKTPVAPTTAPAETPSASVPTSPVTTAGVWDGTYSASCTMNCRDDHCLFLGTSPVCIPKSPISQKFDFTIRVKDNTVISGTTTGYISEDGLAYNYRIVFSNNNEASFNYHFSLSGGNATVTGGLMGGYDDYGCSCDFSGSRPAK